MKIYVDLVILLNFLFDFILLFAVGIVLKRNTNLFRLIIASLVGGLTILALFIDTSSVELFFIKIVISIGMVIIAFGFKDIKYTFNNLFYLYTSSIILGGFLYFLNIQLSYKNSGLVFYFKGLSINFIVLIILGPIIIYVYVKQFKSMKLNYSNYYKVDVYLKNGNKLSLSAFLDTGNKLIDPYKKRPIILVDDKTIREKMDNMILVPYDSLNNHGILKCIIPDKIFISGIGFKKNFLVGISNDKINIDGVNCILNTRLMEGK